MHTNSKPQSILMQQVVRNRICLRKMSLSLSLCAFNGEGGGGRTGGKIIKMLHEMSGFRGSSLLQHVYPHVPDVCPIVCTLAALVDLA